MRKSRHYMIWITLSIVLVIAITAFGFLNGSSFGRMPRGERKARIERSPHYRDGEFRNLHETEMMTSDKGFVQNLVEFLFRTKEGLRPDMALHVIRTDLKSLDRNQDILVWFGHSSYFIQTGGKRILVDPVFYKAAPVSFVNKPFETTYQYTPEDMPDLDYLIITHDHWDHLDCKTVKELKDRTCKAICPLGVGEHLEYWGFDPQQLVELDWNEQADLDDGFTVYCLPARHFSGRGLKRNQTLWASFLLETPDQKIYIGGDSGYDTHYAEIGKRFPDIDWAIMENGQYNDGWRYIHLMPAYMARAAKDLNAKHILTVHHSKYALSTHPWDEPLKNAHMLKERDSLQVAIPELGEVINLREATIDTAAPENRLLQP